MLPFVLSEKPVSGISGKLEAFRCQWASSCYRLVSLLQSISDTNKAAVAGTINQYTDQPQFTVYYDAKVRCKCWLSYGLTHTRKDTLMCTVECHVQKNVILQLFSAKLHTRTSVMLAQDFYFSHVKQLWGKQTIAKRVQVNRALVGRTAVHLCPGEVLPPACILHDGWQFVLLFSV